MPRITFEDVIWHPTFISLMDALRRQDAKPRLAGGLVTRGWTSHDIDILVSHNVTVPIECLQLRIKGRWWPVSILTKP